MVIRFLCPNGHKIHCADDRAGKPAKCPKCGVKFRIPELADPETSGAADTESGESEPQAGQAEAGSVSAANEEQIEFLCPNGHRLHGPRSLEGQPGECPECGVKFRVPSYDETLDEEADEQDASELEVNVVPADDGDVPVPDSGDTVVILREDESVAMHDLPAQTPNPMEAPTGLRVDDSGRLREAASGPSGHPLAELFSKLWAERPPNGVIELHLSDGQTIVPDRYARAMSRGSLGVFASTDADGTHTVIAVAWESVSRVVVRGVKGLSEEFRD